MNQSVRGLLPQVSFVKLPWLGIYDKGEATEVTSPH